MYNNSKMLQRRKKNEKRQAKSYHNHHSCPFTINNHLNPKKNKMHINFELFSIIKVYYADNFGSTFVLWLKHISCYAALCSLSRRTILQNSINVCKLNLLVLFALSKIKLYEFSSGLVPFMKRDKMPKSQ